MMQLEAVYLRASRESAMLAEIQALIAPSPFGTPRRSVIGLDGNRLAMILAVLEARCNISLSNKDIFLNVVVGSKSTNQLRILQLPQRSFHLFSIFLRHKKV